MIYSSIHTNEGLDIMKWVETPLIVKGLVFWYPTRYAPKAECFLMLGDHGPFCPVEFC